MNMAISSVMSCSRLDSDDHLSRILLGVEPLRPARFEAFDARFGIPIACDDALFSELEEIMLQPPSAGGCTIAISGPPLAPAATFGAELLFAPPFDGSLRMLIRHPDITFAFRETDIAFEADGVFSDRTRSLDDMVDAAAGLTYLASGQAVVSLTGDDGSFGPIRAPISTPLRGPYLDQLPALAGLAADWHKLLELAGIRSRADLTMDDFWRRIASLSPPIWCFTPSPSRSSPRYRRSPRGSRQRPRRSTSTAARSVRGDQLQRRGYPGAQPSTARRVPVGVVRTNRGDRKGIGSE